MDRVLGIDVSKHQGDVDFEALAKSDDFRFAIVKSSEGKDYEDPKFSESWRKLLSLHPDEGEGCDITGLVRGVYHFARQDLRAGQGRSAGELEARWLCQLLKREGGYDDGCLPPALDWEKWDGKPRDNVAWIEGFVHVVEQELGRLPMIYTGPNVWKYTLGDTDRFTHLPLWEVKYMRRGRSVEGRPPRIPRDRGKTKWEPLIWQWSGGGRWAYYFNAPANIDVPGVRGVCDVNTFFGTERELLEFAKVDAVSPPELEDMSTDWLPVFPLSSRAGAFDVDVARLQGLLMAVGEGPEGLVGSDGLPDGIAGPKTAKALNSFQAKTTLPVGDLVDEAVWRTLLGA